MRLEQSILLAVPAVALALLAAGCGSSSSSSSQTTTTTTTTTTGTTTSTVDWANSFCSAITTWNDTVTTTLKQFSNPSSFTKASIQTAADDVKAANQTLENELKSLGAPDTQSGQQTKQALDSFSTTLKNDTSKIETTAKGVSGLADLGAAVTTIGTTLAAMGTAWTSTYQTIQNTDAKGELTDAFNQASSCKTIPSGK
jgi:hypothetical protein